MCQYLCKKVPFAKYFSQYNHGLFAEHGFCGCFSICLPSSIAKCHNSCHLKEVFSEEFTVKGLESKPEVDSSELFGGEVDVHPPPPVPRMCHCIRGPMVPDVDICDLKP